MISFEEEMSRICKKCGGRCCVDAHPPLTVERKSLIGDAIGYDSFHEMAGYRRIRAREDGSCVFLHEGKCSINGIKPETCKAGPFTFAVNGSRIEIYLKKETICPLVSFLTSNRDAYRGQFECAVDSIKGLVRNLPKDELEAINRIEEPETIKIAEIQLD
ncbi:YkgJ family cysteine cluster protein [Methanothrix sp.]|uniref:YkgJ family cysteine cluster protein n=1 Tax=Methanothrix sp. TaxID=90426 RepID=UPI0034E2E24B